MKIEALSFDNLDDVLQPVWRISRPGQSEQRTENILFDAQLLEFATITLKFEVPILMRDVVCGYRDHVVWAQTSRVNDPAEGFYPWHGYGADQLQTMQQLKLDGVPQDTYRLHLPVTAYTTFSAKLSARRFAKMFNWVNEEAGKHNDAFGRMLTEFSDQLYRVCPWPREALFKNIPAECPWPRTNVAESYDIELVPISYALYAQLIRHRNLTVHSSLLPTAIANWHTMTLSTMLLVSIKASNQFLAETARKRNCWIAQGDLWEPLIKAINAKVGFQLPCDGGKQCPFAADNISRCRDEDPNPPCPIFLQRSGVFYDNKELKHYAAERGQHVDWWQKEIERGL